MLDELEPSLRPQFEEGVRSDGMPPEDAAWLLERDEDGKYRDEHVQAAWGGFLVGAGGLATGLAEIETAKQKQITSSLALLDNPLPGMVVEGRGPDGSFRWVRAEKGESWGLEGVGDWGFSLYGANALPTLKALVASGGATVTLPEGGEG